MKRTITSTALSGAETRRLIGAKHPRKASSASLTVSAVAISGTGCGPFANHVVLQRAERTVRGRPRPARPVRSHKTLSNSGRRYAWGEVPSYQPSVNGSESMAPSETWEGLLALAQTAMAGLP